MAKTLNIALEKIEAGTPAADGDLSPSLDVLGNTFKESASITQEDNQTHEFEVEEQDEPIESIVTKKGTTTIKWELVEFDPEVMVKIWGGTVNGDKWEEPEVMPEIELSVRLTPKIGKPFTYPRCKISAKIEYNATRAGIARITITATKLKPKKAGVAAFIYG
jgi:hypothetical protein